MPVGKCKGCGRDTNSTCSNWWDRMNRDGTPKSRDHATECYAAWDEKRNGWVKGCAYHLLDRSNKYSPVHFADSLIKEEPTHD